MAKSSEKWPKVGKSGKKCGKWEKVVKSGEKWEKSEGKSGGKVGKK